MNIYCTVMSERLNYIHVPVGAVLCSDVLYCSVEHKQSLSMYCTSIIDMCVMAGRKCFPVVKNKKSQVPYWNESVQPLEKDAMLWNSTWVSCGRPREGIVADIKRSTKLKYHYAIRKIKRKEDSLRYVRMAEAIINNKDRDFWSDVKKMGHNSKQSAPHIDSETVPKDIAQNL